MVPCCVFPKTNSSRVVRGDDDSEEAVVSYEQFVRYLCTAKGDGGGGVQREDMVGFEGRRTVVFTKT